jgi:hypothetical protein
MKGICSIRRPAARDSAVLVSEDYGIPDELVCSILLIFFLRKKGQLLNSNFIGCRLTFISPSPQFNVDFDGTDSTQCRWPRDPHGTARSTCAPASRLGGWIVGVSAEESSHQWLRVDIFLHGSRCVIHCANECGASGSLKNILRAHNNMRIATKTANAATTAQNTPQLNACHAQTIIVHLCAE